MALARHLTGGVGFAFCQTTLLFERVKSIIQAQYCPVGMLVVICLVDMNFTLRSRKNMLVNKAAQPRPALCPMT